MTDSTRSVTAPQGSQPTLGGIRIGIMNAATIDGVSKAKLLVRPPSGDTVVVLTAGEPKQIPDVGTLVLDEVIPAVADVSAISITLRLLP